MEIKWMEIQLTDTSLIKRNFKGMKPYQKTNDAQFATITDLLIYIHHLLWQKEKNKDWLRRCWSFLDPPLWILALSRHHNRQLILQLPCFKQKKFCIIRSNDDPLVRHPSMGEEVLWFHLLEGKLLEVALAVTVQLEDAVPDNTDLSIVLRIEWNL